MKIPKQDYHPQIIEEEKAERVMTSLGCARAGVQIMLPKTKYRLIKLKRVRNSVATILKQEMLSLGGDVAVHEKTSRCEIKATDILMMGTLKHYKLVIKKMAIQSPPEAKKIAEILSYFLFKKKTEEIIKTINEVI